MIDKRQKRAAPENRYIFRGISLNFSRAFLPDDFSSWKGGYVIFATTKRRVTGSREKRDRKGGNILSAFRQNALYNGNDDDDNNNDNSNNNGVQFSSSFDKSEREREGEKEERIASSRIKKIRLLLHFFGSY